MITCDARSLPALAQEDLRHKAVVAVMGSMTQVEAAEVFGVTRQAVGKWIRAYREGGASALRAKRRGRPKGGMLLPWQAAQVVRMIQDRRPDQLKMPFYLWTRGAVREVLWQRYGVNASLTTIGRYLARWGFTPQKPLRRAFERDPEAVRRWLEEEYPSIRQEARREDAEIHWGDQMGLRSDHAAGRSYGRRGETPVVPATGQRFGCNMISTITNRGHLAFMVFQGGFQADVFLEFLGRLVRHVGGKVFLIVDRHPVHRARKVSRWVARNEHAIRLFFLPGYSPELNPDEMLNQDVKTNALGRRRPHTREEMIQTVRGYLRKRQRQPQVVKAYFQERHVRYAAV